MHEEMRVQVARIAVWDVHHVSPDDSLDTAMSLMEAHRIRHLPVVEVNRPVGMISDRDLLLAIGWRLEVDRMPVPDSHVVGPRHVHEIMSIPALHVEPECAICDAARIMIDGRIHALPIVQEGDIKGLVTSTDLLEYVSDLPERELDCPVSERMHVNIRAISRSAPLYQATRVLRDAHIRHLPVLDGSEIVGIVTDRDLRRACGTEAVADKLARVSESLYIGASRVEDIMSGPVETLTESATFREAVRVMVTRRVGCVPIVRCGQLVGIVTDTDCLRFASRHARAGPAGDGRGT